MSDQTVTAPPQVRVEGTFPRDPRLRVRDHQRLLRQAIRETLEEHHARHIPWHFEPFAHSKYGYHTRNPQYVARKVRMGLGNVDNVASGATRATVMNQYEITATSKGGRLIMRLPFRGGTGRLRLWFGQTELSEQQQQVIRRIEEIRAIAPDESRYNAEFLNQRYAALASAPGVPHRVRNRQSKI